MIAMQAQLNTLSLVTKNPTMTKRKFYCSIFRINLTHGSKTCLDKKLGHKEDSCCKKVLGGSGKRGEMAVKGNN